MDNEGRDHLFDKLDELLVMLTGRCPMRGQKYNECTDIVNEAIEVAEKLLKEKTNV